MCPSGSTRPELTVTDNIYQTAWTKPDGTPVSAIWTPAAPIDCKLSVEGVIRNAYDMNGKSIAIPKGTLKATTQVVYLEGATKITISK